MKKIAILVVVGLVLSAGAAFAACQMSGTTFGCAANSTAGIPAWTVNLSKSVTLDYEQNSSGLSYALSSWHTSGDKTYGSSSGDTKIFVNNATGVGAPTAPAVGSTADFSGWIAL